MEAFALRRAPFPPHVPAGVCAFCTVHPLPLPAGNKAFSWVACMEGKGAPLLPSLCTVCFPQQGTGFGCVNTGPAISLVLGCRELQVPSQPCPVAAEALEDVAVISPALLLLSQTWESSSRPAEGPCWSGSVFQAFAGQQQHMDWQVCQLCGLLFLSSWTAPWQSRPGQAAAALPPAEAASLLMHQLPGRAPWRKRLSSCIIEAPQVKCC